MSIKSKEKTIATYSTSNLLTLKDQLKGNHKDYQKVSNELAKRGA